MRTLLTLLTAATLLAPVADAADLKIATVDLSLVMAEVDEGKQAEARLKTIYDGKAAELQGMEANLRTMTEEYQSKASILSDAARQEQEQVLYQAQMTYQQAMVMAEQEMMQAQAQAMESLMAKMKVTATTIAKEKGYDMVLESSQGIVVFSDPGLDITTEVIQRYNAGN